MPIDEDDEKQQSKIWRTLLTPLGHLAIQYKLLPSHLFSWIEEPNDKVGLTKKTAFRAKVRPRQKMSHLALLQTFLPFFQQYYKGRGPLTEEQQQETVKCQYSCNTNIHIKGSPVVLLSFGHSFERK